jgi:hypothetical protein
MRSRNDVDKVSGPFEDKGKDNKAELPFTAGGKMPLL